MSEKISARTVMLWATHATAKLEHHQAEINAMNVFPIPDSDTGSNMAHTMAAAVADVQEAAAGSSVSTVTSQMAAGAVKGARGNSGMVLSQVFRALAQKAAHKKLDAEGVVEVLEDAADFAAQAIVDPVEGTVLTVLRDAASGARDVFVSTPPSQASPRLIDIAQAALDAAKKSLSHTLVMKSKLAFAHSSEKDPKS